VDTGRLHQEKEGEDDRGEEQGRVNLDAAMGEEAGPEAPVRRVENPGQGAKADARAGRRRLSQIRLLPPPTLARRLEGVASNSAARDAQEGGDMATGAEHSPRPAAQSHGSLVEVAQTAVQPGRPNNTKGETPTREACSVPSFKDSSA